ncbi:MAG: PepSY-associated TM helix domain-containing protein [Methylococcales bacterium]
MTTDDRIAKPLDQKRRAYWLKTLHQWHWISSAVCLVAMLGFAITGITLNNAASISAEPVVTTKKTTLPKTLLPSLEKPSSDKAPLPENVADWVNENTSIKVDAVAGEWSEDEVYLTMPRAGGDAWLSLDRSTGAIEYEVTDRGWVSYFNDLHKGRNTGNAWSWFIDAFAVACIIFSGTGLFLLQLHSRHRPGTWPVVALGLLLPVVLVILFVH